MRRLLIMLLLGTTSIAFAQKMHNYSNIKPAEWVIPNSDGVRYSLDSYKGSKALIIKKNFANYKFGCVAYPKNLVFKDGEIELDMASSTGKEYLGLAFRIQGPYRYECLYFRPESSNTINAIQYMPEKKDDFNWYDYEADKYQAKAKLPSTDWFHVKAVIKGQTLTVYVNRDPKPAMVYTALDPSFTSGSVGFWFGNSLSCAYKNLTVKTY